jgi:hypothetical protein
LASISANHSWLSSRQALYSSHVELLPDEHAIIVMMVATNKSNFFIIGF